MALNVVGLSIGLCFQKGSDGRPSAEHHPFTSPTCSPEELLTAPEKAHAAAYDVVVNGYELGGGSIRIANKAMQAAFFEVLNMYKHAISYSF